MTSNTITNEWDLFISHASEDKDDFVQPLATTLSEFGVKVWYDAYSLSIGDSLSRSIDKGLSRSDYGLIVISPSFIVKRWPEYELRGLNAREMTGKKVILPIWHNVNYADVLAFSPPLADKFAVQTAHLSYFKIAVKIIEVVRPDIFTRILRRVAFYRALDEGSSDYLDPRTLRPSPVQHQILPADIVGRIRLIRAALFTVYPQSMRNWLDGFKRDSHPTKEIVYWEHLSAAFQEYVANFPSTTPAQRKAAFRFLFSLGTSKPEELIFSYQSQMPTNSIEFLVMSYGSSEPCDDIEDQPLFSDENERRPSNSSRDTEMFPNDFSEEIVRKVMNEYIDE